MPERLREAAPAPRRKTILLPAGGASVQAFIAAESPVPVELTANPKAPLGRSDLGILIVESVEPALRAAATRLLTEEIPYVVLVRRDVWHAASRAVQKLLDEVQQDPRRKLIRFWRDREELERTLRDEVLTLDDWALVAQSVRDGEFVRVGSTFEQSWELENTGFQVWDRRELKELASECVTPDRTAVPIPRTEPGRRVTLAIRFTVQDEPMSCRSVWQMVGETGRLSFPWSPGVRCQVLAVL